MSDQARPNLRSRVVRVALALTFAGALIAFGSSQSVSATLSYWDSSGDTGSCSSSGWVCLALNTTTGTGTTCIDYQCVFTDPAGASNQGAVVRVDLYYPGGGGIAADRVRSIKNRTSRTVCAFQSPGYSILNNTVGVTSSWGQTGVFGSPQGISSIKVVPTNQSCSFTG